MEAQENFIEYYLKQRESRNIVTYPFTKRQFRELLVTLSDKYKLRDMKGLYALEYWTGLLEQKAKKRYINWVEETFNLPLTNKDYEEFLKYVKETEIDDILSHI